MIVIALVILLMLIGLSIPVGIALGLLGVSIDYLYSILPLTRAIGELAWGSHTEFLLVAIPLFIMLGEILLRSGFASKMYDALSLWLSWLPGGIMHANIVACTLFAATSGSSVATAATVGTVALPQARQRQYNEPLFLGSLAAGGTLGILIPPSINLVIYAVLTDTSIPKLYLAGIVPGFLLCISFMGVVWLACIYRPAWGGTKVVVSTKLRIASLIHLLPPLGIFALVVGSIYAGIATPTEAAALGVVGALALAGYARKLNLIMLKEVMEGTMRSTAMIMLIVMAAGFLNFVMSATGLTDALTQFITELGLNKGWTLVILVVFYLILGCFMETLSMMIMTIPIVAPVMMTLGYDPIWFGIIVILLVETALITPPVGLNLFVVHHLRQGGLMADVIKGSSPFVIALLLLIMLLAIEPNIVLWLPQLILD